MVRQKLRAQSLFLEKKSHGKQKVRTQFLLFKKKAKQTSK